MQNRYIINLCFLSLVQVFSVAGVKSLTSKIFSDILSTFLLLTLFKLNDPLSSYEGIIVEWD